MQSLKLNKLMLPQISQIRVEQQKCQLQRIQQFLRRLLQKPYLLLNALVFYTLLDLFVVMVSIISTKSSSRHFDEPFGVIGSPTLLSFAIFTKFVFH